MVVKNGRSLIGLIDLIYLKNELMKQADILHADFHADTNFRADTNLGKLKVTLIIMVEMGQAL